MDDLREIRESQIRTEETNKTILDSIKIISADIDKIKESINNHSEDIITMQAESKYSNAELKTIKDDNKDEVQKLWERIRDNEKTQSEKCEKHDKAITFNLDGAKKDVFKDVKIWLFGIILAILLSCLGTAVMFGVQKAKLDNVISDVEELKDVHK